MRKVFTMTDQTGQTPKTSDFYVVWSGKQPDAMYARECIQTLQGTYSFKLANPPAIAGRPWLGEAYELFLSCRKTLLLVTPLLLQAKREPDNDVYQLFSMLKPDEITEKMDLILVTNCDWAVFFEEAPNTRLSGPLPVDELSALDRQAFWRQLVTML